MSLPIFQEYYIKISVESVKCRVCSRRISNKGGDNRGLARHLETIHFQLYSEEVKPKLDAQKTAKQSTPSSSPSEPKMRLTTAKQRLAKKLLLKNTAQLAIYKRKK